MSFINIIIPKIDKLKHFYLWTLLYLAVLFLLLAFSFVGFSINYSFIISCLVVLVTAFWKEFIIDGLQGKGKKEVLDIVYSVLAPVLFTLVYFIVYLHNNLK